MTDANSDNWYWEGANEDLRIEEVPVGREADRVAGSAAEDILVALFRDFLAAPIMKVSDRTDEEGTQVLEA